MWCHQRNFIFGTKLISHFLYRLQDGGVLPDALERFLRNHVRVIYLVRRDKVRQAISDFLANKVKLWHVYNESERRLATTTSTGLKSASKKYFFRYKYMTEQEDRLGNWVAGTNHIYIDYEELVSNPEAVVGRIANFLGFDDVGPASADIVRISGDVEEALRHRFEVDYAERFGHLPPLYTLNEMQSTPATRPACTELQSLRKFRTLRLGLCQNSS